jgi:hypothetical protein
VNRVKTAGDPRAPPPIQLSTATFHNMPCRSCRCRCGCGSVDAAKIVESANRVWEDLCAVVEAIRVRQEELDAMEADFRRARAQLELEMQGNKSHEAVLEVKRDVQSIHGRLAHGMELLQRVLDSRDSKSPGEPCKKDHQQHPSPASPPAVTVCDGADMTLVNEDGANLSEFLHMQEASRVQLAESLASLKAELHDEYLVEDLQSELIRQDGAMVEAISCAKIAVESLVHDENFAGLQPLAELEAVLGKVYRDREKLLMKSRLLVQRKFKRSPDQF